MLTSNKNVLNADPMAIQQIEFNGNLRTSTEICTCLEKWKQTILNFYKGPAKILLT